MDATADDRSNLLRRLIPRFETKDGALEWYQDQPIPGFSGLTAAQMVAAGRAAEVHSYLDAVDAGTHA